MRWSIKLQDLYTFSSKKWHLRLPSSLHVVHLKDDLYIWDTVMLCLLGFFNCSPHKQIWEKTPYAECALIQII